MLEDKRSITELQVTVPTHQPETEGNRKGKGRQWLYLRWILSFRILCFDR